jgi:5S rRNA maturation endonuclease (ribonuclease M5)
MKHIFFFVVLLFSFLAISQEPHRFNLGGKEIEISHEMLLELRNRMDATDVKIRIHKLVSKQDVQWILDYISLSEVVFSPNCNQLKLLNTRNFNIETDIDNSGAEIDVGLFDYVWEIKVCDIQHNFRVVNQKGSESFVVYALEL